MIALLLVASIAAADEETGQAPPEEHVEVPEAGMLPLGPMFFGLSPAEVRWEGPEGELSLYRWGQLHYRPPPRCNTSAACVEVARTLRTGWPEWQGPALAEELLGPHCQEGRLEACIAMEGARGSAAAWACIDDPASCLALVEEAPELPWVAGVLERGCDAGDGASCARRGASEEGALRLSWLERACAAEVACDERDALAEELERRRLADACRDGDGTACVQLADRLGDEAYQGLQAQGWILEGCIAADADACERFELQSARHGLDAPAVQAILEGLSVRCEAGEAGACRVQASLLRRVKPRDVRYGQALELFGAACGAGDGASCLEAADYRRIGRARKVDEGPEPHWSTGCQAAHGASCARLGAFQLERRKTRAEGRTTLQTACEQDSAEACGRLGEVVIEEDAERGRAFLQRSCEGGYGPACRELGALVLDRDRVRPDHDAYPPFVQGCDAGDAQACLVVARAHKGLKTSWDDEQRYARTEQACDAGSLDAVPACRAQARLLKRGRGVERDRQRGRALARAYAKQRTPRYLRASVGTGLPGLLNVGAEALLPARLPIGISAFGELGRAGLKKDGTLGRLLESGASVTYGSVMGRVYLSRRGSGVYAGAGVSIGSAWMDLLGVPEDEPLRFAAPTVRAGINVQGDLVGLNLELGAVVLPEGFGTPIAPVLALRFALAPR